MTRDDALSLLPPEPGEFDEPTYLPKSALRFLVLDDLHDGALIGVGETKDNVLHMEWEGHLFRAGDEIGAHCEYSWTRKYWESPLGLAHYMDLVRRGIETRERLRGDVKVLDWDDDDGPYIHLIFEIYHLPKNLAEASDYVVACLAKFAEPAEEAALKAGAIAAEVAQSVSGWGNTPLELLVEFVERAQTTDEKGRSLEELVARLFGSVPGWSISGRRKTETEEIDLTILNGSDDVRFKQEAAIILVECKNWSSKCGKDEFVLFEKKLRNRKGRCSIGFLVSWNGFSDTITKEMLRASHEDALIVPVSGKDVREMVRSARPLELIAKAWFDAVHV